jgi:hypothetical protein
MIPALATIPENVRGPAFAELLARLYSNGTATAVVPVLGRRVKPDTSLPAR